MGTGLLLSWASLSRLPLEYKSWGLYGSIWVVYAIVLSLMGIVICKLDFALFYMFRGHPEILAPSPSK
jgi:hypothetical protein